MRVWMWYARVSMLDAEDIIKQQRTLLVHDLSKLVLTLHQLHLCHTRISLASNTHHDLGTNQDHVKHVRSTAWRCTKPAHLVHDCHLWLGNCSGPFQHENVRVTDASTGRTGSEVPYSIQRWLAEKPHQGPWNGLMSFDRSKDQAGKTS
jgi:hypothetical protein